MENLHAEAKAVPEKTYRLVHHTESNLGVALVFGSNLRPKARELGIGRAALSNDSAVPAGVVVDVDNAHGRTSVQAALDLLIKSRPVLRVESTANTVHKELPAHRNAEGVEAVVVDEVLHLVETGLAGVDNAASGASAVSSATKIEASDL